jgi:pentatricopeptide repeat protein
MSARYPDFKHKLSQEALWLDSKLNPAWVKAELSAMAPGTVQSDILSWNMRLARFVKAGQYKTAIEIFQQLQQEGMIPDTFTFVQVLNTCAGLQALEEGRHIQAQIMEHGCEYNVFVGTSLLYMYAKCRSIEDAWRVFNRIPTRNVVTWNAMIVGHVNCGQGCRALELY